jgi:VWFA-related protein
MLAGLFALLAVAQIVLNPPKEAGTISVDVNLVNVICTARTAHGGYVEDLTKDDFELREDGHKRDIAFFAREVDSPLTIALLLDVSGSVAMVIPEEREGANQFFAQVMRPGDKAMLVGFAQLVQVWQDLTPHMDFIHEALGNAGPIEVPSADAMEMRPRGGTLLYDAVKLVTERKLERMPGRKAIILVTDGLDNGSIAKLDEATRAAQSADTAVYVIHYANTSGLPPMEKMANATGGRAVHVSEDKLSEVFKSIADELHHQYGIGFTPAKEDKEFHKIELKCKRAGVKVQARTGYRK